MPILYGDELTANEAAMYCDDLSPHTLRKWRSKKQPDLKPYMKDGKVHYQRAVLDEFLLQEIIP